MSNISGTVNKQYLIDQLKNQYGEDLGLQTHVNLTTVADMIEDAPEAESDRLESEWIGFRDSCDETNRDPYPNLQRSNYLICKHCGERHVLRLRVFGKMFPCVWYEEEVRVPKYCSNCGAIMKNVGPGKEIDHDFESWERVVHCKDCTKGHNKKLNGESVVECGLCQCDDTRRIKDPMHFCGHGVRREGEE